VAAVLLSAVMTHLCAQQRSGVARLAVRLAGMTAVTGYEQAIGDSLLALLPGSARDRLGDVTLVLGQGTPRRLAACPLDEVGFVVGGITEQGYLTLRRIGAHVAYPLFDQQLEGQRVTVFGTRGAVPGVVAVKSIHLARDRGASDAPFTADNAYVDVGAATRADALALGAGVLSPVALTKHPVVYGDGLLAAPASARRAACAALATAAAAHSGVHGTVVIAFAVQSHYSADAGLKAVRALFGPFDELKAVSVSARYPDTAVETVALADVEALERQLELWIAAR